MARSGLIAALLLAYLVGPLNQTTLWRGIVVSSDRVACGGTEGCNRTDSQGIGGLRNCGLGSIRRLAVLRESTGRRCPYWPADRATGHAVGADVAILDEAGLLQENSRDLWNAVLSSTSGRDGRMLSISIQGDGPMFAELKERADAASVLFQLHAAPDDCDLDDPDGVGSC